MYRNNFQETNKGFPQLFMENTPQELLNNLKFGGFSKMEVVRVFQDDHEICVNVIGIANGVPYRFSNWWIDEDTLRLFYRAETAQKYRDELLKLLLQTNEDNQACLDFLAELDAPPTLDLTKVLEYVKDSEADKRMVLDFLRGLTENPERFGVIFERLGFLETAE